MSNCPIYASAAPNTSIETEAFAGTGGLLGSVGGAIGGENNPIPSGGPSDIAEIGTRRIAFGADQLRCADGSCVRTRRHVFRRDPAHSSSTLLAGISAALGYRGSLEVVNRIAPRDKRSEVVSSYLIAVYLGNSLPIIGIGLLSEMVSSIAAHLAFAVIISLLAAVAFATGTKYAPRQ
jgi:hypothetical protein